MKVVLFANTDWYLYNFRRSLALALREAGHEVLLVSPPGDYGTRLQALGLRWVPAPMQRQSLNPFRELALLLWLRSLLRREQADVVHGFTIKCAVYGSLAARLAGGARRPIGRVLAVAGMGYVFISQSAKARLLRPLLRTLLRTALGGPNVRLVLQNPDDVALFRQARLVQDDRLRLIPGSGVDCKRFVPGSVAQAAASAGHAAAPANGPDAPLRVLLPARMLWDKGVAEFVEAARRLRAQGRVLECLLAGAPDPGNPAAVPERVLREWAAEGAVHWLGHVEDMPALLASAHIVALPSYREGLPKGLIEAAACALPLVTTDVPGCREVVTHEVNGLLVPPRDAAALAAALARLQDDSALRTRLGAAARERALREFDERIVVGRTLEVYAEVAGR